MQTLYLVHIDKNNHNYGVELYCVGIFDSKEAAEEQAKLFDGADITEIELNSSTTDVYLDSYRE